VAPGDWNDWHWQQRNRLRRPADFADVFELSEDERRAFADASQVFRIAVTPHYAALMRGDDPTCPLRRQALPATAELTTHDFEMRDPLAEDAHMPVPGLTHRYPDRALLYVTHNCPVYCRHCTRKRKVSDPNTATSRTQVDEALDYIRRTPEIRDVLVSGGDPLSLSDEKLDDILGAIRRIDHVEVVRVGTRNPVTLPQRITPALADVFRRHGPIYLHTHFNHPDELNADAERALRLLLDARCVLGNQMVLLRGVNDDADTVMRLNRRLLELGCRPYYMLQCDMARGITHFRTPLALGVDIIDALRGRIGGMGIPDFVVDLPGGGGKVELAPDPIVARRDGNPPVVQLRSWSGRIHELADPAQS
jgi:lysine 2,3-aminomutase